MSKIYNMIESQINNLLRFKLEDDWSGEIKYNKWISGPKAVKPFVQAITTLIFLAVILTFGLYLWNTGLVPVFPGIVAPIDPTNPSQAANPYVQLILTLLALMMLA